jgi:hypothetical protein
MASMRLRLLLVSFSLIAALAVPAAAYGYVAGCNAWHYSNITYSPSRIYSFFTKSFTNLTDNTHTYTTGASNGGTVGMTITGTASVDAGVIFASVSASASVAVTANATVSYSSGVSGPIPPHSTVYVYYGRYRVVAVGDYYFMSPSCVKGPITRVTAKVPRSATEGWVISPKSLPHDGN